MSLNKPTQTILSTLYYPYIQHPLGGIQKSTMKGGFFVYAILIMW